MKKRKPGDQCPDCDGTGHEHNNAGMMTTGTCEYCKGTGEIPGPKKKLDLKPEKLELPKERIVGTFTMNVETKWEPKGELSPEELRVWVAAATSVSIPFPGGDMKRVAEQKAEIADAILNEYRKRFMTVDYKITSDGFKEQLIERVQKMNIWKKVKKGA